MQKIVQYFTYIFTKNLCPASFLSSYRSLPIIDLIGLYNTRISTRLPAQCPMSHGIPDTHQLNPAYSPCRSPSAAPIIT